MDPSLKEFYIKALNADMLAGVDPCPFQCPGCHFCDFYFHMIRNTEGVTGPLTEMDPKIDYGAYFITGVLEVPEDDERCPRPGHLVKRQMRVYGPSWPNDEAYHQHCVCDGVHLQVSFNPDFSKTRLIYENGKGRRIHEAADLIRYGNRIKAHRDDWNGIRRLAVVKGKQAVKASNPIPDYAYDHYDMEQNEELDALLPRFRPPHAHTPNTSIQAQAQRESEEEEQTIAEEGPKKKPRRKGKKKKASGSPPESIASGSVLIEV